MYPFSKCADILAGNKSYLDVLPSKLAPSYTILTPPLATPCYDCSDPGVVVNMTIAMMKWNRAALTSWEVFAHIIWSIFKIKAWGL